MAAIVRVDGRTTALEAGVVGALDHGFLYGNGLFETLRATNGTPFAFRRHVERMQQGGAAIGLPVPRAEALAAEVSAALADAGEDDVYVRLTVSRGVGAPGPDPSSCREPTVVVLVKPFPPPPERWLTDGVSAEIAPIRRNLTSPLTRVKSLNASGPILPGITRQIVLELAAESGASYREGSYGPGRLISAEEAFLTNSLYGLVPLGSFDGHTIGRSVPGPVTEGLNADYEARRRRECGL
jgi:branched-chain amino acid aminotransferase